MHGDNTNKIASAAYSQDAEDISALFLETRTRIPRLPQNHLDRKNLTQRITDAIRQKSVVLLCAPAGYGKTATLARIARTESNSIRFFWVSLGEEDNISTLLSMAYVALDPADVPWKISRIALTKLASSEEAGPLLAANAVAHALRSTEVAHGAIVLDDLHRVKDPAVFRALDRLMERLPRNWSLVLSTREEPTLSLTRMRLKGEIAEFRSQLLEFNLEEFKELAALEKRQLSIQSSLELWKEVAGWPAGCELILQSNAEGAKLPAGRKAIFDILSRDVFLNLPLPTQNFLLPCAVLPELNEHLCQAVTGSEKTLRHLREIRSRGLFLVEITEEPPVLRLHDLFREFLMVRLREEYSRPEIKAIYCRAASAEQDPEQRIRFLLNAEDAEGAEEELLNAANALLLAGDIQRVRDLISLFPSSYTDSSAAIAYTAGLCCDHQFSTAQRDLGRAVSLYAAAEDQSKYKRARSLELLSYVGPSAPQNALAQLEELQRDADPGTKALCALAQYLLARISSSVETEMYHFDRMLVSLEESGDPLVWNVCAMHIYLGLQRGMASRTERYATATLAIASPGHGTLRDSAMSMRTWHYILTGRHGQALELIDEIEASQNWSGRPYAARGGVMIAKSLAIFFRGTPAELQKSSHDFMKIFDGREGMLWVYWRGLTHLLFGKLFAAQENWTAVDRNIEGLSTELRILDVPYLRLGLQYLTALRELNEGTLPNGNLMEALSARPLNGDYLALEPAFDALSARLFALSRQYQEAWRVLAPLVNGLQDRDETIHLLMLGAKELRALAEIPFAGATFPTERKILLDLAERSKEERKRASIAGPDRPEGLTAREIEILKHMERGDSNKLIARAFGLSPHTVKRHVANILEKLQVSSRGQASAWFRANVEPQL